MRQPRTPNVLKVWAQATEGERRYGKEWYPLAHRAAHDIATKHGTDVDTVAAVISALSPNNKWHRNLVEAERYVEAWTRNEPYRPSASTYSNGQRKAWNIINGALSPTEAFETGTAWKTRAFYMAIADPYGSDAVVIDGHAWNIATDQRVPLSEVGNITTKRYEACTRAYVRAAIEAGVTPQTMQATCWIVWRRLNSYQLDFDADLVMTTERI